MLLSNGRRLREIGNELDSIHNYYEHPVFERLLKVSERARADQNFMADVACVALNHLPPRYIRHDVDMTFFLSPQEMLEIEHKVEAAVEKALLFVSEREAAKLLKPTAETAEE